MFECRFSFICGRTVLISGLYFECRFFHMCNCSELISGLYLSVDFSLCVTILSLFQDCVLSEI